MDEFIRSLDAPVRRDLACEASWNYHKYSDQVEEALDYHSGKAIVSEYLAIQISKMIHQGYVLFGENPFSTPVISIYEAMERLANGTEGRRLKRISNAVGLEIFHIHFSQSSCIIENWVNHARKTKLVDQPFTREVVYGNLISSLSKPSKTGEWLVYNKTDSGIKIWCIWRHRAGDEGLIEVIKENHA